MPPHGVMSPSSPPGTDNPQVEDDKALPKNEILPPGRTRARTRAYHQASTMSRPADHALFNQRPPNQHAPVLPTCHAGQLSEPATYQEALLSPYHANWSHAMEKDITGLKGAGTFGDALQQKGGNVVSAKGVFSWKADDHGKVVMVKSRLVARGFSLHPGVDYYVCPHPRRIPCPYDGCDSLRFTGGFMPFRCTTSVCPGRTPGTGFLIWCHRTVAI